MSTNTGNLVPSRPPRRPAGQRDSWVPAAGNGKPKQEPIILFQKFFKSVGPRTYAAQVKELANGNHLLVLTEGKRDEQTGEVRKTRLFLYGEDFTEFFKMLHETAAFLRANPVPDSVRQRREKFWSRKTQPSSAQPSAANGAAAGGTAATAT